jgi:hypothetical protein
MSKWNNSNTKITSSCQFKTFLYLTCVFSLHSSLGNRSFAPLFCLLDLDGTMPAKRTFIKKIETWPYSKETRNSLCTWAPRKRRGRIPLCCRSLCLSFKVLSLQFNLFITMEINDRTSGSSFAILGFHVTSSPPCWCPMNKRFLISVHC